MRHAMLAIGLGSILAVGCGGDEQVPKPPVEAPAIGLARPIEPAPASPPQIAPANPVGAPTAVVPEPEPASEPSVDSTSPNDAPRSDASRSRQARQCASGDNRCVVDALEGYAESEGDLALLIEAYRAMGNTLASQRHMRTYVERFPNSARARNYRQILERHGAVEARPRTDRASETEVPAVNGNPRNPF